MKSTPRGNRLKRIVQVLLLSLFLLIGFYILFVESERYESQSIIQLKNLESKQKISLSEVLFGQGTSTMQDSALLELYIRSHEMYRYLDKLFDLSSYYSSPALDPLRRLYPHIPVPMLRKNKENLLRRYNSDLSVVFDAESNTLKLAFADVNATRARSIVSKIIAHSEEVINAFARENAQIALKFIDKQREIKRKEFIQAIRKLIEFQNRYHTIDPTVDVKRKIQILSELETELVKAEVQYATKLKTFNPNSREMTMLRDNIRNLKRSIAQVKSELSGHDKSSELNKMVFEYQILKNDMEFAKEVYKQTLINLEELRVEVAQKAKHLVIVVKPTLPDDYTYPDKWWDLLTLMVLFALLYGIIMAAVSIIENHRD